MAALRAFTVQCSGFLRYSHSFRHGHEVHTAWFFVSWQECVVTSWLIFLNVVLRSQTRENRYVYKCLLLPFRPMTCIFPHSHKDCGFCSIGFNSCTHEGLNFFFFFFSLSLWKVFRLICSVLDWDEVQCLEMNLHIPWKLVQRQKGFKRGLS